MEREQGGKKAEEVLLRNISCDNRLLAAATATVRRMQERLVKRGNVQECVSFQFVWILVS